MAGLTFGGARKKEIADVSQIQRLIDTDPQIQAILRQPSSFGSIGNKDQQIRQILEARGLSIPEGYQVSPTGHVEAQQGFWEGFGQYGVPALVGTYAGTQAFAGSGAGSGAASGAGGIGTNAGTIADPGIGAAGVPNSIAAGGAGSAGSAGGGAGVGTATSSGTPSLWHTLAGPIIGGAVGIFGSALQANAQNAATEAQAKAAEEALAFLKQKYAQTQGQVAPYIASGQGALANLDTGLGINASGPARPVGAVTNTGPGTAGVTIPNLWKSTGNATPTLPATIQNTPATTTAQTPQAMTLASLGQASQTASGVQPARVGEQRLINGQPAQFDGQGWLAIGAA